MIGIIVQPLVIYMWEFFLSAISTLVETANIKVGTRKWVNEKWEIRKWGSGKQTADILLLQSRESQCLCMHSLRDHLCLTVGTKGICNDIASQSSMYKCFTFSSLHVSHFLKVVEPMNCPYFVPTLYKEPFWSFFMQLLALLWIIILIFVSHTALLLKQHLLFKFIMHLYPTEVHKMPVAIILQ